MNNKKLPWWKLISTWGVFLLLHFSYETFPNTLFKIIGEEGETNYFHMKMLFFAYLISSLAELILQRRKIHSLQTFFTSRMLIATVYPWMTITIFFLSQALTGDMLEMPWEIIWANLATFTGIYTALRLEEIFDMIEYRPALRWLILLIFSIALLTYIVFSFSTPTHFFQTPAGYTH
jgi:hypothetical protein